MSLSDHFAIFSLYYFKMKIKARRFGKNMGEAERIIPDICQLQEKQKV